VDNLLKTFVRPHAVWMKLGKRCGLHSNPQKTDKKAAADGFGEYRQARPHPQNRRHYILCPAQAADYPLF